MIVLLFQHIQKLILSKNKNKTYIKTYDMALRWPNP